jgi:Zn-dependent metalloprotease
VEVDAAFKRFIDDNDTWAESGDDPRHTTAIDAHYAAQSSYDFLRDILGRDSLDGKGEKILMDVHMGRGRRPRTLWNGTSVEIVEDQAGRSWSSLDMIGRQLIRGMVERTVPLASRGEPWAVGATLRAVLGGAGVEWYAAQRNPELAAMTNPYVVGEQVVGIGEYKATDMANPANDGSIDHYKNYNPGQFTDALGIGTNAFYLLTHGGTNATSGIEVRDPIDLERALKIYGQALFKHLPKDATYKDLRQATIAAAGELYGAEGHEVQKLREAWNAVGVEAA